MLQVYSAVLVLLIQLAYAYLLRLIAYVCEEQGFASRGLDAELSFLIGHHTFRRACFTNDGSNYRCRRRLAVIDHALYCDRLLLEVLSPFAKGNGDGPFGGYIQQFLCHFHFLSLIYEGEHHGRSNRGIDSHLAVIISLRLQNGLAILNHFYRHSGNVSILWPEDHPESDGFRICLG